MNPGEPEPKPLHVRIYSVIYQIPPGNPDESPHGAGFGSALQRHLLEEEGIEFDLQGHVDWRRFGWPSADVYMRV